MNVQNDMCIPIFAKSAFSHPERECSAGYLGLIEYKLGVDLQQRLRQDRKEGFVPNILLLLEHPPVYTIGKFGSEGDVMVHRHTLLSEGVSIIRTTRGGKITYHGPGQLIGYPILNLRELHIGVRDYVFRLEEVVIRVLRNFHIQCERVVGRPGVWVRGKKICSIGINVSRDITMHGFALNVNTELRYFDYIKPCGLPGSIITSMAELLGHSIDFAVVVEVVIEQFASVFNLHRDQGDHIWQQVQDYLNGLKKNQ